MRTIDIDDDIYNYILRQTEVIGEPASSILRRLLNKPSLSRTQKAGNGKVDQNQELSEFVQSSSLLGCRTATKRFLQILSFAFRQKPESFKKVLSFPTGRSRVYFAQTREEIERSGKSTHPKKIPGAPFWALTNTDTLQKREILSTTLKALDYDARVVSEAAATIA